jgi:pre-rRNA-processing protein TSR3
LGNPEGAYDKVKLYIYHAAQCDPRKCTALKMLRFGLAKRIDRLSHISRSAVVLDPYSNVVLSNSDCNNLLTHGLVAVDCSWENAEELFTFKIKASRRRLPEMLAGNPVNYALKNKLSTVEAFAGALITCGFLKQAYEILAKFKWGQNFLRLNNIKTPISEGD